MVRFAEGEVDVLVATTIIENGLDIPNANTILIHRADHFGLAQLYQLRGRVGRSAQRGHCYLLYNRNTVLSYDARRRLEAVLESSEELGAGFRIAMRDLEIRGTGDLLGARQSGHIDIVGFDLYTRLLAQAINEVRRKKEHFVKALQAAAPAAGAPPPAQNRAVPSREELPFDLEDPLQPPVQLDLPLDARIPATYLADEALRLQFYRRIAGISQVAALDEMRAELVDRFGKDSETDSVPEEIEDLFFQIRIKGLAARAGVERIGRDLDNLVLYSDRLGDRLEGVERRTLERRLRLADGNGVVSEAAPWVGRRAIYLPIDESGQWRQVLLRTLELLAVS